MSGNDPSNKARSGKASVPPLTDSGWFWSCIFTTAAICALMLASSKFPFRQAQLENRFLARQEAGQTAVGDQGPIQPSSNQQTMITLRPLYVVSGLFLIVAWSALLWQRTQLAKQIDRQDP